MLKPEYIQRMPRNMVELYEQAEADILADMARRISTYDYWIPAVEHQAKMLEEAGMVREEIIARLRILTKKTEDELVTLMKEAGTTALKSDDEVYRRAGLNPPPVSASEDLQSVLQAGFEQTNGEFINLTKTTARTATMQFERALDRAYMQIALGGMDYNTSIRNAIKQLSADGVGAIKYPSGKVDSIEVAVRRAVVTGVNQTALKLQDARADEMGADLVEVSAHAGARPEHAVWQGGIYSRSGKSKKYPDFVKTTGYGTGAGLGGWNCSHSFRPWFEGMIRTWSKEQLADYQAKDYEYNGVKMTEYEALQEQRKIERGIRRWKREKNAMEAAGLDSSEASAKVREWNRKHKDFLEQTGLKADGTRTVVCSWKPNEVATRNKSAIIKAEAQTSREFVYKRFYTGEDVNNFFYYDDYEKNRGLLAKKKSQYGQWEKSLTDDQKSAIDAYTTGGYADLNDFLRKRGDWDDLEADAMIAFRDDLSSVISGFDLKEPIKVYRYTGKDTFGGEKIEKLIGHEWADAGFMSTSPAMQGVESAVVTGKDYLLEIDVPAGKGIGAYINDLSPWKDVEYEFLLKDGTKFEIADVDTSGDKPIIKMVVKL